jgi:ribosomal protein L25 (general stress protein Ctc)
MPYLKQGKEEGKKMEGDHKEQEEQTTKESTQEVVAVTLEEELARALAESVQEHPP